MWKKTFNDKVANIRAEYPLLESSLPPYSFEPMDSIMPYCTFLLESFTMITSEELIKIIYIVILLRWLERETGHILFY